LKINFSANASFVYCVCCVRFYSVGCVCQTVNVNSSVNLQITWYHDDCFTKKVQKHAGRAWCSIMALSSVPCVGL